MIKESGKGRLVRRCGYAATTVYGTEAPAGAVWVVTQPRSVDGSRVLARIVQTVSRGGSPHSIFGRSVFSQGGSIV